MTTYQLVDVSSTEYWLEPDDNRSTTWTITGEPNYRYADIVRRRDNGRAINRARVPYDGWTKSWQQLQDNDEQCIWFTPVSGEEGKLFTVRRSDHGQLWIGTMGVKPHIEPLLTQALLNLGLRLPTLLTTEYSHQDDSLVDLLLKPRP